MDNKPSPVPGQVVIDNFVDKLQRFIEPQYDDVHDIASLVTALGIVREEMQRRVTNVLANECIPTPFIALPDPEKDPTPMSDPEDKTDQHRDAALNGLVSTIESTGGLVTEEKPGSKGATWLVPKGDTEREWADLANAYLNACKALGSVPLIDGKRRPKIRSMAITVDRSVNDELSDDQNDVETAYIHEMTKDLPDDVEVAVLDRDGVFLYDGHREV